MGSPLVQTREVVFVNCLVRSVSSARRWKVHKEEFFFFSPRHYSPYGMESLAFVAGFFADGRAQMHWHRDHLEIPVFVLAAYLAFIYQVPKYMQNKKAFEFKPLLAVWNLSLALFSFIGASHCLPVLWKAFTVHGFR